MNEVKGGNMEGNEEIKEEKTVPQMIKDIHEVFTLPEKERKQKIKEMKLPSAGKVSKGKAKKGWIGVMKIEENRNINFEKQPIDMQVYKTKDGVYRASDGREIFFWKGRPLIIQPSWRQNPWNPQVEKDIPKDNNVYGQKPILARMQTAVYKEEKKKGGFGGILMIIVIAVVGYIIYNLITKGKIF